MGKSAECERLIAWTVGKPPLLGLFALTIAYAAHTIDLLVRSTLGEQVLRRLAATPDADRQRFYRSGLGLMRDTADAMTDSMSGGMRELCEMVAVAQDPGHDWRAEAEGLVEARRDPKAWAAIHRWWAIVVKLSCRELSDPTRAALSDGDVQRLEASPAFSFVLNVIAPYLVRHYEFPQTRFQRVLDGGDQRIAAVQSLLANDPELLWNPAIAGVLRRPFASDTRRRLTPLAAQLTKGPRKLGPNSVVQSAACLISCMSHLLDAALKAPEIAELFDLAAAQRLAQNGGKGPRVELRLPRGETLTKCLHRGRQDWMPFLDPDGNFRAGVRALRGLAA